MKWKVMTLLLPLLGCDQQSQPAQPSAAGCASLPNDERLLVTLKQIVPDIQSIVGVTCGEMLNPPGIGANIIEQQPQTRQEFRAYYLQDEAKWVINVPITGMLYEVK